MSAQYNEEFKRSMVQKLLGPNRQSPYKLSKNLGIAPSTFYSWMRVYGNGNSIMKKNKKLRTWSREEKLNTLIKASSLTENELGVFLREKGLHTSDLELIRKEILMGPQKPTVDPELRKIQHDLDKKNKELNRKDKALAEMAARVVLLKKSHEIWGESEEDE